MRPEFERAARAGDVSSLEQIIGSGVSIDALDRYGKTALMLAAHSGRVDAVERLASLGARLDVTVKFGLSALMLAIVAGHEDVARALVRAGADLTIRGTGAPGFSGKTAHVLAMELRMTDLCRDIAAAGRDTG